MVNRHGDRVGRAIEYFVISTRLRREKSLVVIGSRSARGSKRCLPATAGLDMTVVVFVR
jgi:hypothetical protein